MTINLEMSVLVVDDNDHMRKVVCGLLSQIGFNNVDTVTRISAAMGKMHKGKYGLVITSWNMKPTSGFKLLEDTRNHNDLHWTPFIVSIPDDDEKVDREIAVQKAGARYVITPFNGPTLRDAIEGAL